MATIGFIGLGNMGVPMASNLIRAGHRVRGYDVVPAARTRAAAVGVTLAETALATALDADVIITMLQRGEQVLGVHREAIFLGARPDSLLIDCSTIDVASARTFHQDAAKHGLKSLDAPVSGGVAGAVAGTLTFMAGGEASAFNAAHPLLAQMGRRIVHCGGAGAGQAAKICNNLMLGVSMIAVSEAFLLAERLGLSAQALFDVASNASGQCWALTSYCPVPGPVPASPANRNYQPGFAADLMLKDLRLALEAASQNGLDTAMLAQAEAVFERMQVAGRGSRDFSDVINLLRAG